jgi:Zn-dependent protease with chaperone function
MNPTPPNQTTRTDTRGTATGKCLGIPVRYDPESKYPWGDRKPIVDSQGFLWRKKIVVRPDFFKFPAREQQAFLLHEAAHCKLFHAEKRILRLLVWPFGIFAYCRAQEFIADRFVLEMGYAADLARAFARFADGKSRLHPPTAERIARLIENHS